MKKFKFVFYNVNEKGRKQNFLSKKGSLAEENLRLAKVDLAIDRIVNVSGYENLLEIVSIDENGDQRIDSLQIEGGKAGKLRQQLGVLRSELKVQNRQSELAAQNRGAEFQSAQCPACLAILDLTDVLSSPQLDCEYCDAIFSVDHPHGFRKAELKYKHCVECHLYAPVRRYSTFYFYFLIFLWGFSSGATTRCAPCMRPIAWKMLFINFIFILGTPVALIQLVRSYVGESARHIYPGIDSANAKTQKGKYEEAIQAYTDILGIDPDSAGIHYNLGMAYLANQKLIEAKAAFEDAVKACALYRRAHEMLEFCNQELAE